MIYWQKMVFGNFSKNTDKEILNRVLLFNIGLAIYIITAVPFGIMHVAKNNYIHASILFAAVVVLIGTRVFLNITKKYRIDRLVYFEETDDVNSAIAREKQIKGWLRKKKVELIEDMNPTWSDLSIEWYEE